MLEIVIVEVEAIVLEDDEHAILEIGELEEKVELEDKDVVGTCVLVERGILELEDSRFRLDEDDTKVDAVEVWVLLESAAELGELELNEEEVIGAWVPLQSGTLEVEDSRIEIDENDTVDDWVPLESTTELEELELKVGKIV